NITRKLRRLAHGERSRPRQLDVDHAIEPSRSWRHDHNAIGEKYRFWHAVSNEQHRHAPFVPDLLEVENQLVASERIERAERLVHQQLAGIVDERATQRNALAHTAGEVMGGFFLETAQAYGAHPIPPPPLGFPPLALFP